MKTNQAPIGGSGVNRPTPAHDLKHAIEYLRELHTVPHIEDRKERVKRTCDWIEQAIGIDR